ncbi:S1C family serine protease [Sporosarcina saromensis]|uniref:S1C family serine protease n=1 Tax=Sporosarcina saromensis TaxID=359365 RepID=A0ABU4GCH3_9BACL|nr:S1C family serine protease [Sporosarcina saromensis]MDW0114023.1 S1C family serine protease [Sporosarcina saromensis]
MIRLFDNTEKSELIDKVEKRADRLSKMMFERKRMFVSALTLFVIGVMTLGVYLYFKDTNDKKELIDSLPYFNELVIEANDFITVDEVSKYLATYSKDPQAGEVTSEIKEDEESEIELPKRDLTMMIANAKSIVYTIYTDREQGSGFLFNELGDVVTNAHVVKDATLIRLKNSSGKEFNGRLIGISDSTDVALIRVEELKGKQPMEIETKKADIGTEIFALGSPEDIANTSTTGYITKIGISFFEEYNYTDLYEMNARIRRGSSGGPLISAETEKILGINSIVLNSDPSIGYAISMTSVLDLLQKWSADPLQQENWEEEIEEEIEEAHLDESLIKSFIVDYYELIPYTLNDSKLTYYTNYILPDSQAMKVGAELVQKLTMENRVYDSVKTTPKHVEVDEKAEKAVIEAVTEFTYHEKNAEEPKVVTYHAVYTIIIDQFGDYQITNIDEKVSE